ncbi:uncharacterized protein LOC144109994 [Amblyomma americanum]
MSGTSTSFAWTDQLDLARACTSEGPEDRCWLISELPAWNDVLYGLAYELAELRPGKLSLRYIQNRSTDTRRDTGAREAACLISRLFERHHGCIYELRLLCAPRPDDECPEQAPVPIRLRPPPGQTNIVNLLSLELKACTATAPNRSSHCYLPEGDIAAIKGLEQLRIASCDGRLEPGLFKLLRRNAGSLKFVQIADSTLSRRMVSALHRLDKCESMTVWLCAHDYCGFNLDPVSEFVQGLATTVKTFKFFPLGLSKWRMPALAHALVTNVTLTTLELHLRRSYIPLEYLFFALEGNASLRSLRVSCRHVDASCGQALESALIKNACLRDLGLAADVADGCMLCVADALARNPALESLDFTGSNIAVGGVFSLCNALFTNTTLKKLVLPGFEASRMARVRLADILARGNGYSRVRLPLGEPDMTALSIRLARRAPCPEVLRKIDISNISGTRLKTLFSALAVNSSVRALSVMVDENVPGGTAALCEMLSANRTLRRIDIYVRRDKGQFVPKFLDALQTNQGISELSISIALLTVRSASAMCDFFARNRRIAKLRLWLLELDPDEQVEVVVQGVSMNPIIVEFEITESCLPGTARRMIFETMQRNRTRLNRAVDFVVLRAKNRLCAEAFELFSSRACFVDLLMKCAGLTERETPLAISSAQDFLLENYLVITGIVNSALVCHPAPDSSTQCNDLDAECWRAIVRHLKVTDVLL